MIKNKKWYYKLSQIDYMKCKNILKLKKIAKNIKDIVV